MNRLGLLRSLEAWERVEGCPAPLGATWIESERAWNFALFSRHATAMTLLLYAPDDVVEPVAVAAVEAVLARAGG